jgi:hypothetical protein
MTVSFQARMFPSRSFSGACAGPSGGREDLPPILLASPDPLHPFRISQWASMRDAAAEDKPKNGYRLI